MDSSYTTADIILVRFLCKRIGAGYLLWEGSISQGLLDRIAEPSGLEPGYSLGVTTSKTSHFQLKSELIAVATDIRLFPRSALQKDAVNICNLLRVLGHLGIPLNPISSSELSYLSEALAAQPRGWETRLPLILEEF